MHKSVHNRLGSVVVRLLTAHDTPGQSTEAHEGPVTAHRHAALQVPDVSADPASVLHGHHSNASNPPDIAPRAAVRTQTTTASDHAHEQLPAPATSSSGVLHALPPARHTALQITQQCPEPWASCCQPGLGSRACRPCNIALYCLFHLTFTSCEWRWRSSRSLPALQIFVALHPRSNQAGFCIMLPRAEQSGLPAIAAERVVLKRVLCSDRSAPAHSFATSCLPCSPCGDGTEISSDSEVLQRSGIFPLRILPANDCLRQLSQL